MRAPSPSSVITAARLAPVLLALSCSAGASSDDHEWQRQFPGGDPLVRHKRINSARVAGAMYVFAGYDFVCDEGGAPHQIWDHDVYRFEP